MNLVRTRPRGRQLVAVVLAALSVIHGLALDERAASAAAGDSCTPNSEDRSIGGGVRCVAEALRNTRSALQSPCVLDPKAVSAAKPLYQPLECKKGTGTQAEAIAQARYIAQMSASNLYGDVPAGGITPNAQWEVTYPARTTTSGVAGRVDYLEYPRAGNGAIQIVELKQNNRPGQEATAQAQANRYVSDLPPGDANRAKALKNVVGYVDRFRVLRQDCKDDGSVTDRIVTHFSTRSSTLTNGVLMIDSRDEVTAAQVPTTRSCRPSRTSSPTTRTSRRRSRKTRRSPCRTRVGTTTRTARTTCGRSS